MRDDTSAEILDGIKIYLGEHFPDTEFADFNDANTGSVILHGSGQQGYRLEVTRRFLDGDDGVSRTLDCIRRWNVARILWAAGQRLVMVTTTGVRVEP